MTGQPLDSARVAAFLEGRLSDAEREHVLALMASDPEWREILPDASAVIDELTSESATIADSNASSANGAESLRDTKEQLHARELLNVRETTRVPTRAKRRNPAILYAMAAAAVLVLGAVYVRQASVSTNSSAVTRSVLTLASANPSVFDKDPSRLVDRWPRTRSNVTATTRKGVGVKLGALAVDLLVFIRSAGNARNEILDEMNAYLNNVDGSGSLAAQLSNNADPDSTAVLIGRLRMLVDTAAFDAGVSIEAMRLMPQTNGATPSYLATVVRSVEIAFADNPSVLQLSAEYSKHYASKRIDAALEAADSLLAVVAR